MSSIVVDVTDEAQCRTAVAEVVRRHQKLNILVNNAGIGSPDVPSTPDEMSRDTWEAVIGTNLTAVFVMSKLVYPEMKKAGGGKIINIGSASSYLGSPRWTAYGSAKGAIVQFSKNCASAWGKDNIQVNTICPGLIDTALTSGMLKSKEFVSNVVARTAAGRVGTPDDLAGIAAFLSSSVSDFITGADIPVDGGLVWGI